MNKRVLCLFRNDITLISPIPNNNFSNFVIHTDKFFIDRESRYSTIAKQKHIANRAFVLINE